MAAWYSRDGEFAKSTTTCAPSSASARPSPVIVLTPVLGAAARASCPRWVSLLTTFEPMSPVPPMTTTSMTSPFVELFAVRPTCAFRKPHPLDSQQKRESDHD